MKCCFDEKLLHHKVEPENLKNGGAAFHQSGISSNGFFIE
jgi:hypothetical protein